MADDYVCTSCGRPAPSLENVAILEWEGGAAAHFQEERDPQKLGLICPSCLAADRPEDEELGGG